MRAEVEVAEKQMGDSFLPDSDDEGEDMGAEPTMLEDSDDEDTKPAEKLKDSDSDSDSDTEQASAKPKAKGKKKPPTVRQRKTTE